jgi:molybdopterin-binding protein
MLPYDLTGFSASMHIRRTIDSTTPLVVLNNSNGRIEIQPGGAENAIRLNLSASITSTITSDGVYDLEITDGSGSVQRILKGSVTLSPQVTR